MKRCPQCNRVEPDVKLAFCRIDGTPLVSNSSSFNPDANTAGFESGPVSSETQTEILQHRTDTEINRVTAPTTVLSKTAGAAKESRRLKQLSSAILITAVGLGVAALAGYLYVSRRSNVSIQSIAVLPFENASGNADLDYLSEGVSESVLDRLSQLPQLKVIARSSSFRYRGNNLDLKKVADSLGVQAIVTGRVVQRGDSYLIRVDVTDVGENKQLWGENFTRKMSDLQIMQTDISREIAENLSLRLNESQRQPPVKQPTSAQAYELVLKAVFYRNKGSAEDLKKSIECYQQAITIDPNYALAYAGLADSYRTSGLDAKENLQKREAAARKALELDDNLAEAHFSMGQYQRDLWQWQEAGREFQRAMQLNPNASHAYSGYSGVLSLLGRHDEAINADKRAKELDPVGIIQNTVAGRTLHYARRYDEAIEQLKKTIDLDPRTSFAYVRLADVYVTTGRYQEAIAQYEKAIELGTASSEAKIRLAAAYAKMGERQRSLDIMKQLQNSGDYISPAHLAIFYAALGDREQAFATLEKGYSERSPSLQSVKVDPAFDSLRSDPRFQDLLRRMGLSQ
jgi:TolB-like protein/Tfp pilus assembly protein PilF